MKRIEISGPELEKIIHTAAAGEELEIGAEEQELVNQVVASAPENLTPQRLGVWCNVRVEGLIKDHPELKEKAEIVRTHVRNELNFRLLKERIDEFKLKVDEAGLKILTPKDVSRIDNLLYQSVQHAFRRGDGQIDWDYFSQKSGIEVKYRNKTIGEAITELNKRLLVDSPQKFGPYFVRKNYPELYNVIWNSNLPWDTVIAQLDKTFQDRWRALPVYEDVKPKETYRNDEEVNQFLDLHKDELSTIVEAGPNDIKARDKIISGLVLLAQKGNNAAFDRALEYSEYIVNSWILKRKLDPRLENFSSDIKDALGRCIYLYKGEKSFVAYIYSYIRLMAKGLRAHNVEFNEGSKKHNNVYLVDSDYDFDEEDIEDKELEIPA